MSPIFRKRRAAMSAAVLAATSLVVAGTGRTEEPAEPPAPPPPPDVFFIANGGPVMALGAPVDVIGGEGSVVGQVVAGKPYTADAVTEFTQRLADGNRITHTNKSRVYRDAAGRTRREHVLNSLGAWQPAGEEPSTMIVIDDPIAGTSYILDPASKSARQMRTFRAVHDAEAGVVTWETAAAAPLPPGMPASGNVTVATGSAVPGEPGTFEMPLPPGPPPVQGSIAVRAFPPIAAAPMIQAFPDTDATTEDLGEQEIQGVLANGTRDTQVISAGAIGNERAIEIVSEQWYSPDLEAVVMRRNVDPCFGETTYELVNLVQGEPPGDLFAVPADYEVSEAPAEFGAVAPMPAPPGAEAGVVVEKRVLRFRTEGGDEEKD